MILSHPFFCNALTETCRQKMTSYMIQQFLFKCTFLIFVFVSLHSSAWCFYALVKLGISNSGFTVLSFNFAYFLFEFSLFYSRFFTESFQLLQYPYISVNWLSTLSPIYFLAICTAVCCHWDCYQFTL